MQEVSNSWICCQKSVFCCSCTIALNASKVKLVCGLAGATEVSNPGYAILCTSGSFSLLRIGFDCTKTETCVMCCWGIRSSAEQDQHGAADSAHVVERAAGIFQPKLKL
jgi:hypothetical protein